MAYNQANGIVPKTIVKGVREGLEISDKNANAQLKGGRRLSKVEREQMIDRLTREMKQAAKLLEFEHAAFLRDQIDRLRRGENPTQEGEAPKPKRGRKGR